jgi:hypothetical protein
LPSPSQQALELIVLHEAVGVGGRDHDREAVGFEPLVGGGPCGSVEGLEVLPVRVQVAGGCDGGMSRLLAKFFLFLFDGSTDLIRFFYLIYVRFCFFSNNFTCCSSFNLVGFVFQLVHTFWSSFFTRISIFSCCTAH